MTDLETELLAACRIALRQLNYDGDDKTAFTGAAFDALTKAIAKAEKASENRVGDNIDGRQGAGVVERVGAAAAIGASDDVNVSR